MGSYLPQVLLCIKADDPAYEFRGSVATMMRTFEHADHVPFLELHSFALEVEVSHKNSQLPTKNNLDTSIENERNTSVPPPKTRSLPFPTPKTPARKNMTQYVS